MKAATLDVGTSPAEVTKVDAHGIWVLVGEKEYFLPHEDLPWFRKAKIDDVLNLAWDHDMRRRWPALDADLSIDSLEHPDRYPVVEEG